MSEGAAVEHEGTAPAVRYRRVAVTGVGLICGLGTGVETVWPALLAGRSGVGPITAFDTTGFSTTFAAEVRDFDPERYVERKDVKKMGRFIHFAIAAADEALGQAGLRVTPGNADRVGVAVGSGIGAFEVIEREHRKLLERGPSRLSPFFITAAIVNLAAGQIAIRTGARGLNVAPATACTTGAHAIGEAFDAIRLGRVDAMICGGTEACITPLGIAGFGAMRALSTRNDDPAAASRPWDRDRDGFVVGEGAGILILEALDTARQRGATILAELAGYGATSDAYHVSSPPDDGAGARRAMEAALQDAGVGPDRVHYVNAHATSTDVGDHAESLAIAGTFGAHAAEVAVGSTKSMTGHLLGGAGAFEAGVTVLAVRDQIVPPTINLDHVAHAHPLRYVRGGACRLPIEYALSNSFGFGGTNASLVFRRASSSSSRERAEDARSSQQAPGHDRRAAHGDGESDSIPTDSVPKGSARTDTVLRGSVRNDAIPRGGTRGGGPAPDQAGADQAGPDQACADQASADEPGADQAAHRDALGETPRRTATSGRARPPRQHGRHGDPRARRGRSASQPSDARQHEARVAAPAAAVPAVAAAAAAPQIGVLTSPPCGSPGDVCL